MRASFKPRTAPFVAGYQACRRGTGYSYSHRYGAVGLIIQKIARLGSLFCEQQHRPLKGLGALLASLAGTVVHRGWPIGQISYPRRSFYTTAPYVLCTYYVRVRVGAALQAMELCLSGPVAGVDVSAGWAGLARVLGWYSHELSSVPAGLVLQLLADGSSFDFIIG